MRYSCLNDVREIQLFGLSKKNVNKEDVVFSCGHGKDGIYSSCRRMQQHQKLPLAISDFPSLQRKRQHSPLEGGLQDEGKGAT